MEIDIYNPDNYTSGIPHAQFSWLRQHAPVYWHEHPDGGGFWAISRHADIVQVSRDHRTFSAERGFVMVDNLEPDILAMTRNQLLGMDPPRHGPMRRPVITQFTSRMLQALEPKIRQIAKENMQSASTDSEINFVDALAGDLPTAVIGSMLQIPADMWPQIRRWSDLATSASDPDLGGTPEEVSAATMELGSYGFQLATERGEFNENDLISMLLHSEVDGKQIDEAEFASLFVQITVAGNETTRGLISSAMLELLRQPEIYRTLESNIKILPTAIEEMLRWSTPLHYFRRTATTDTRIAGQKIAEGDRVMMLYSSGNFDESIFSNPKTFDIRRENNPHLSFGYGIHLCLGANLARLEARIFFEEFFRHFAGIELTGDTQYIRSNNIHGLKQMPVRLTPR